MNMKQPSKQQPAAPANKDKKPQPAPVTPQQKQKPGK